MMVETSEHERAFVTDSVTVGSWEQTWEHGMAALWESTSGIASVKNLAGVKVLAMVFYDQVIESVFADASYLYVVRYLETFIHTEDFYSEEENHLVYLWSALGLFF